MKLAEALAKSGLVPQAAVDQQSREQRRKWGAQVHSLSCTRLENIETVGKFRKEALALLEKNPDDIQYVLRQAQRLRDADGGIRLLWQLYSLRDNLRGVSARDDKLRVIKRGLRRAGQTTQLPRDFVDRMRRGKF